MRFVFVPSVCPCLRPKPNHYLEWLEKGVCAFGDMCKMVSGWWR